MNELPPRAHQPMRSDVARPAPRLQEPQLADKTATMPAANSTFEELSDKLRKSDERFDQLFLAAATGMAISTPHGRFLQANPAYCEMLGYNEAELQSLDWACITHPDDLNLNVDLRDQMLRGQRASFVMEKRYVRKDGSVLSARVSVSAVHEADGEISTLLVMAEDVTERNKAYARLHRLNRLYTMLSKFGEAILATPDRQALYDMVCRIAVEFGQLRMAFVAEVDHEAKVALPVAFGGASLSTLLGSSRVIAIGREAMRFGTVKAALRGGNCEVCNDLAGAPPTALWRDMEVNCGLLACAAIPFKSNGTTVGVLVMFAGEKDFFLEDEVELAMSVANTMSFALEAWERERQRQQAQALSLRLAAIVESSDDPILSHDINGIITSWNKGAEKTFGYSADEIIGTSFFRLVPEEHHAREKELSDQIINGSEGLDNRETVRRTKSGQLINVSVTISPIKGTSGDIVGVSRVSRDITHAKRVEARLRRLMDSNVQGVFFWEMNGGVIDANDAFLDLTRFTREDLKAGRINWATMTPPEHAHLDRYALQTIAERGICTPYEKEFVRRDGSRVAILIGAATFEDVPNEGVCFVLDLTEQKKLEGQVLQAQKMESIGALAAGVAHDFNNILAVIQMQADLLKSSDDMKQHHLEAADDIVAAVERAATLTRQLLLFSSREVFQPQKLELRESITETLKMIRRILGEHIQMEVKFDSRPLHVHADRGMIDQILLNLVVNARDAMPLGGRLVIEAFGVDFDGSMVVQPSQERTGSFVCLSVSDSGCGIPAADLPRIFEPFFTTKDVGKGTGLGLATVFGIVRQHQGWVAAYSEVGHGATFRVYLPLLPSNELLKPTHPLTRAAPTGSETILLVEDDAGLRVSMRTTLLRLGYRILEAPNAIQAQQVFQENRRDIRLLLTDIVMPGGMTGLELIEWALSNNPNLKVVCMSGYSNELVARASPASGAASCLTKPFQAIELAQAVRNALDRD